MKEKNWVMVCPSCLSPVKNLAFSNPAAVNFGALNNYACTKCGKIVQPIEVDAKKLSEMKG